MIKKLLIILTTLVSLLGIQMAQAEDNFLEPDQAFAISYRMLDANTLQVHYDIAKGYYMYRERFDISSTPAQAIQSIDYPQGDHKYDPNFKKELEIYHHQIDIPIHLQKGLSQVNIKVVGQGCAEGAICYPPMDHKIQLILDRNGAYQIQDGKMPFFRKPAVKSFTQTLQANDQGIAQYLGQSSIVDIILICFVFGVLLSFTPCVLPMLPILLSVVVGSGNQQTSVKGVRLTLAYVFGMSIVYTALGVIAASLGAVLAVWIQNPWVLSAFALLLVLFALSMFGWFNIQMPSWIQTKLNQQANKVGGGKFLNAFVMGMLSALICGPCVAAPLAGVLLFIAQTGNVVTGAVALFSLAWGQGVLLLILGGSSGRLMPKMGAWMERVKVFCGLLLLVTALWIVQSVLSYTVFMLLLGIWFLLTAVFFLQPLRVWRGWTLLAKLLGILLLVYGVGMLVSVGLGQKNLFNPWMPHAQQKTTAPTFAGIKTLAQLQQALQHNHLVLLDYYADWCTTCLEMEHRTFSDPTVQAKMGTFTLLRVDVTKNTADDRVLLKAYQLFGPPAILIFKDGQLKARVVGFQDPETFLKTLSAVD